MARGRRGRGARAEAIRAQRINALVDLLREEGWSAWRTGAKNVIALKARRLPRYIHVTIAGDPLGGFKPSDEKRLILRAAAAGAIPEVAWWPDTGIAPLS